MIRVNEPNNRQAAVRVLKVLLLRDASHLAADAVLQDQFLLLREGTVAVSAHLEVCPHVREVDLVQDVLEGALLVDQHHDGLIINLVILHEHSVDSYLPVKVHTAEPPHIQHSVLLEAHDLRRRLLGALVGRCADLGRPDLEVLALAIGSAEDVDEGEDVGAEGGQS